MSQSMLDVLDDESVIAPLQRGPNGKLRLSYEYPRADVSNSLGLGYQHLYPVIEIDSAKLRKLQFSQQELDEIGFSLLARLSTLL
jgi:hypothetical protein